MKKYHKHFQQRSFAHRGLWNEHVPENSLAAFVRAVEYGYGIECDVRLSADGVPVIFHDDTLERMTGDTRRVARCDVHTLTSLKLLSSDESIPTLSATLARINGAVPVYIEIKNTIGHSLATLHAVMHALSSYTGPYVIASFDARIVSVAARKYHAFAAQIFYHDVLWKRLWSTVLWYLYGRHGSAMSVPIASVQQAFFKKRRECYPVFVWTAKNKNIYDYSTDCADYVIFEGCLPEKSENRCKS